MVALWDNCLEVANMLASNFYHQTAQVSLFSKAANVLKIKTSAYLKEPPNHNFFQKD